MPYIRINSFREQWAFLSNYNPPTVDGLSVEHHFQAAKTLDEKEKEKILRAATPTIAKNYGRAVELRPDWEDIKIPLMKSLLVRKFDTVEGRKLLLSTEDAFLVEENTWHDIIWGECICREHKGEGENYLGLLLMEVREEIQ